MKRERKTFYHLTGYTCSALLLIPLLARAAETEEISSNIFTLGEVEVSATAEDTTESSTETITSETLQDFERNTVGEAIPLIAGSSASRTGRRNEQTLSVRGFDIKHVPLFIDGIPVYVPYDGYPDLGRFTTYDLSEIVVSKGFSSVLYGPNTMGGAINLVTRRPKQGVEGDMGVGIESGDTYSTYLNMGAAQEKYYLQLGASYIDSDHTIMSDDFNATSSEDGGDRNNSYYTDKKINLKAGYTPNSTDEYAISYINQKGEKGSPPYAGTSSSESVKYWQWPYWDKESVYFTSTTSLPAESYVKTRFYYDTFKNALNSYDDATYSTMNKKSSFKSTYDDYTDGASVEVGTETIENHLVKLALHYKEDVHRETNDEDEPQLRFEDQMFSAGLEDTISLTDSLSAVAGISYDTLKTVEAQDYDDDTGTISNLPTDSTNSLNPQLGLFYDLTESSIVHASVAMKSRLPSLKDKYSYKLGTSIPNPDLDPEHSINYEIGYENTYIDAFNWKSTIFFNDVSDYIDSVTITDPDDASATTTQNQNIGDVDLYGFEFEFSGKLIQAFEYGGNYTFTRYDNKSNDEEITDIPEHKIFVYGRYSLLHNLSAQLDAEYDSSRYSSTDASRETDDFTLVGIKLTYDIGHGFSLDGGIKNLFDEYYEYTEGYPEPGRTYFATLRYRF